MPKHVRTEDYGRFRIFPTPDKRFILEEKRTSTFGIKWRVIKWKGIWGDSILQFDSIEKAKEFIDKKLEKEYILETAYSDEGAIYYP